jgi:carbonic anhydrase
VTLHGWCYSLNNGHITNLEMTVPGVGGLEDVYNKAVEKVAARRRD